MISHFIFWCVEICTLQKIICPMLPADVFGRSKPLSSLQALHTPFFHLVGQGPSRLDYPTGTQSEHKAQQLCRLQEGCVCVYLCLCVSVCMTFMCWAQPPSQVRGPPGLGTSSPLGNSCFGVGSSSSTWCTSRSLKCLMLVVIGDKMLHLME